MPGSKAEIAQWKNMIEESCLTHDIQEEGKEREGMEEGRMDWAQGQEYDFSSSSQVHIQCPMI